MSVADSPEPGTVPVPIATPASSSRTRLGLVMLILVYFVGAEEVPSSSSGSSVDELVHDPRHLFGFPVTR